MNFVSEDTHILTTQTCHCPSPNWYLCHRNAGQTWEDVKGKGNRKKSPWDCTTLIPEHPFHYSKSSCIMLSPHSPRGYGWQIPGAMETFGKHLKNHKCFHKLWLLTSVLPWESWAITVSTKPKLIRIHSPGVKVSNRKITMVSSSWSTFWSQGLSVIDKPGTLLVRCMGNTVAETSSSL